MDNNDKKTPPEMPPVPAPLTEEELILMAETLRPEEPETGETPLTMPDPTPTSTPSEAPEPERLPMEEETPEPLTEEPPAMTPPPEIPLPKRPKSAMGRTRPVQPPRTTKRRKSGFGWNLGYFIREGFVGIFRHGLMSMAAVCTIIACLLITGTFALVAVNLDVNLQEMVQQNEFLAYVDEGLSLEKAQALKSDIMAVENVRTAEFVDRVTVLEKFRDERQEDSELYELLPNDVFRHRYRIHVDDIAELKTTIARVKALPGVANISAAPEIADGMLSARNVATGVAMILVVVLVVVSLFIIVSTLRLATFYRRDEIAIMKMCGATNGFIRWPFVMEGILLGLVSGLAAFFLQWWLYTTVINAVVAGGQLQFLVLVPFVDLRLMVLEVFCAVGLLIGVVGSLLGIRKFLQV